MKDDEVRVAVLLKMYEDERSYARQHNNMRLGSTTLVVLTLALTLRTLTIEDSIVDSLYVFLATTAISLFGLVLSTNHALCEKKHLARARVILAELDPKYIRLKNQGDSVHKEIIKNESKLGFQPLIASLTTRAVWMAFYILISIMSVTGVAVSLHNMKP